MNNKQPLSREPHPTPASPLPAPVLSATEGLCFLHLLRPQSPALRTDLLTSRCQVSSGTQHGPPEVGPVQNMKTERICSKCRSNRAHTPEDNQNTETNEPRCLAKIQAVLPNLQPSPLLCLPAYDQPPDCLNAICSQVLPQIPSSAGKPFCISTPVPTSHGDLGSTS